VYQNIRKFSTYILASNVPEVAPFLAMLTLRIPSALTVLQILAVDLGTDLLPALGLGAEPPEPDVMAAPPRRVGEAMLNRPLMLRAYLFLGLLEAVFAMTGYLLTWRSHGVGLGELQQLAPDLLRHTASAPVLAIQRQASAVTLGAIVFGQIGTLLACRSDWKSIRSLPLRANPWIWLGIGSELLVYGGLLFIPVVADTFQLAPIPPELWWWLLICTPALLLADEARKGWVRRSLRSGR
jgi:Ca2+-transporting ATPase